MGTRIEEAIIIISDIDKAYRTFTPEEIRALKTTLNVMRKYQKIQEIYQWAKDRSYLIETDDIMDKLKEVVEDGNDSR